MLISYGHKTPHIAENVYIAPTAVIIGDVEICENASIWFGAVLRGDMARIRIGGCTNIQDNCTIHTDAGHPARIGEYVTVGHNAVVHGCTIEDDCLIGIHAVVLNDAVIRQGSTVAAGSVVKQGQQVGPLHLVAGIPAVLKKRFNADHLDVCREPALHYVVLAHEYTSAGLKRSL